MDVRRTHRYDLMVSWTGDRGTGTSGYRAYGRDHLVTAGGRPLIEGSSDPVFFGDKTRWNPELELVAALAQCHMLSYFHVCAAAGVVKRMRAMKAANGSIRFSTISLSKKWCLRAAAICL